MLVVPKRTDNTKDAVKMVENAIKESENYPTERELWQTLRKKIHYITFKRILRKFERENKIMYDKDGSIIWTFIDSPEARESLRESIVLR